MYTIAEVQTRRDLMRFVRFPDELYRNCPQYVPALHSDQVKTLTRCASLSYCTRKMWLAKDGDKVVGRICAMVNPRYNSLYHTNRVRFGWFDTIADIEVARLLLSTAEAWAKEQGMDEIHGPLFYNTLGKQGMLVEGFQNIPPFNCIYNFPYYPEFMEKLGFVKECDWVQYKVAANHGIPEKARRIASIVEERYGLHVGRLDELKKDPAQVRKFFHAYSDTFSKSVYNFIPFTDEEIDEEAKAIMPFVSDKISCVVMDSNNEVAGFAISFPSISRALQKAHGHLFPFGWVHVLKAMNNYEYVDLMLNGVVPEWDGKGVSALSYRELSDRMIKSDAHWGITNPQIETNSAVNIWSSFENEPFMRRRCYIKKID